MIIFSCILAVCLVVLYVHAEVHHARKGSDVWDWAHKLSNWLKTKGY